LFIFLFLCILDILSILLPEIFDLSNDTTID